MPIETKVPTQAPRTLEAWVKLLESVRIPVPKHSYDRVMAAIHDSRRSLRDIAEPVSYTHLTLPTIYSV